MKERIAEISIASTIPFIPFSKRTTSTIVIKIDMINRLIEMTMNFLASSLMRTTAMLTPWNILRTAMMIAKLKISYCVLGILGKTRSKMEGSASIKTYEAVKEVITRKRIIDEIKVFSSLPS